MTTATTAQGWLEEEVRKCQEDREPGLWRRKQAGMVPVGPRLLYRRWQHLNRVLGTETIDTWLTAIAIGGAVAVVLMIVVGWASYGKVGPSGWGAGAVAGILLGSWIGYSRFITMVFQETYIEVIVNEYQSAFEAAHEAADVVRAALPRLGFILRPEVFEGNQGETGFRDRKARIRLRTPFGMSIHDLREAKDFYGLPADDDALDQGANMERYSIETLVRSAGHLYRLYGVPRAAEDNISRLAGKWHWILLIAAMVTVIFLLAG